MTKQLINDYSEIIQNSLINSNVEQFLSEQLKYIRKKLNYKSSLNSRNCKQIIDSLNLDHSDLKELKNLVIYSYSSDMSSLTNYFVNCVKQLITKYEETTIKNINKFLPYIFPKEFYDLLNTKIHSGEYSYVYDNIELYKKQQKEKIGFINVKILELEIEPIIKKYMFLHYL